MIDLRTSLGAHTQALDVVCGAAHVVPGATIAVKHAGLCVAEGADISLLVDAPVGFALHALERREWHGSRVIVTTTNTCPEYVEDLWDYRPDALLAGQSLTRHLREVVSSIERDDAYRLTPGCETSLTSCERQVLRLLARGWGNTAIACQMHIQPQTVANSLTQIYSALEVADRQAALLCYWGVYLAA